MPWQLRHQGSPTVLKGLTFEQIVEGLRAGSWEPTDEVLGPSDKTWSAIESHPQLAEIALDLEPPQPLHRDEETRLDMNALIDVCLVLLIFFILTTTYAAAVQKLVPLPSIKGPTGKARVVSVKDVSQRMIRLQVYQEKDGKPAVRLENQSIDVASGDGKGIDPDKLREALQPYVRGPDRKSEIILDIKGVSWGAAVAVQDGARSAGILKIHMLGK